MTSEIEVDDLWPRDHRNRYRLYAVTGDKLEVLAAAPDLPGIGQAIATIDEETDGGLGTLGRTGILDAVERRWIVKPWERGDHL